MRHANSGCATTATAQQANDSHRIDTEKIRCHQRDGDRAEANRASAEAKASATTATATIVAAAVFHIVAFAVTVPFHVMSLAPKLFDRANLTKLIC